MPRLFPLACHQADVTQKAIENGRDGEASLWPWNSLVRLKSFLPLLSSVLGVRVIV